MTKEQYLVMRKNGNFNIIYEYYTEHFNSAKHTPFLSIEEMAQLLPMTGLNLHVIMDKCMRHYDEKFNITKVLNREGETIATL